ncbi:SurA N-terminal domain-containing protein, partial [Desulfovibrio sp. OttesenSCG-928-O18]|nr:SurA N-terminal domain-containing protein [Desulfovibrio sp. OttesenSCG-928-O18]
MKRIHSCILALVFSLLPLCAFAAQGQPVERIVVNKIAAVVNGEMITLHELRQHSATEYIREGINPADPAARRQVESIMSRVLSVMIDDMLLRQEAERLKLKASDAEIENELRKLVQRNQTNMKEFEARVIAQGGTMEMVKDRLRNNILSQRIINFMIARKSVVTQEEIGAYYEEHKNDFTAERSVDISLIVFASSVNPEDVYKRIASGALSFEEAAAKFSEGPSPDSGGRLGMIKWEDLAAPFKSQVLQLQNGGISRVFQANSRECMLRLNDSTSGRSMTLEEAA